jgi:hypothetical protein
LVPTYPWHKIVAIDFYEAELNMVDAEIAQRLGSYSKWLDSKGFSSFDRNFYRSIVNSYFEFSEERGFPNEKLSDRTTRHGAVAQFLLFQQTQKRLSPEMMRTMKDALDQYYGLFGTDPTELMGESLLALQNKEVEGESDQLFARELPSENSFEPYSMPQQVSVDQLASKASTGRQFAERFRGVL